MDLKPDTVAEAVAVVALVTGAVDDVAHGLVDLFAVAAGTYLVEPDLLGPEHQLVGLARLGARLADGYRARAIGAVAIGLRAPVERHQLPLPIFTSRGVACGNAPCAPAATIESKLGDSAPRRRMSCSSARASSRSVRPSMPPASSASRASSAIFVGGGDQLDLVLVLDHPHALDEALHGTSSTRSGNSSRARSSAATVVLSDSNPTRNVPSGRWSTASATRSVRSRHALEFGSDLLLGLLGVAEVGQEDARARTDQREAVAARVAGQVADVDQVRDQHQVDVRPVEGAKRDDRHGLLMRPAPFSVVRVPLDIRPGPCRRSVARHSGRITDSRRHGSRESTSERWTSTAGRPVSSSASWIA